nr:MAG TPA: hypothetical protein [Caudoviricetes sp.]
MNIIPNLYNSPRLNDFKLEAIIGSLYVEPLYMSLFEILPASTKFPNLSM